VFAQTPKPPKKAPYFTPFLGERGLRPLRASLPFPRDTIQGKAFSRIPSIWPRPGEQPIFPGCTQLSAKFRVQILSKTPQNRERDYVICLKPLQPLSIYTNYTPKSELRNKNSIICRPHTCTNPKKCFIKPKFKSNQIIGTLSLHWDTLNWLKICPKQD